MTKGAATETDESLLQRINVAALDTDAQLQVYEDARKLRDELILEADDAGHSVPAIARAALMSPTRVGQIIAKGAVA